MKCCSELLARAVYGSAQSPWRRPASSYVGSPSRVTFIDLLGLATKKSFCMVAEQLTKVTVLCLSLSSSRCRHGNGGASDGSDSEVRGHGGGGVYEANPLGILMILVSIILQCFG